MNLRFTGILVLSILVLPGCIATRKDIDGLNASISELQRELSVLRKNQASLSSDIKGLSQTIETLNEHLDENKRYINIMLNKFDDFDAVMGSRLKDIRQNLPTPVNPSGKEVTPTELYQMAYSDYFAGKYDLAILGFENLIAKYPNTKIAADGQYYLSECLFAKKLYENAVASYDRYVKANPRGEKTFAALYRKALVLKQINRIPEAQEIWEQLSINAPETPEGKQAKERLYELTKSSPSKKQD
ncbi:MAG: tetratricopeptide repeat protein [Elusimicrobiota bacterium]